MIAALIIFAVLAFIFVGFCAMLGILAGASDAAKRFSEEKKRQEKLLAERQREQELLNQKK